MFFKNMIIRKHKYLSIVLHKIYLINHQIIFTQLYKYLFNYLFLILTFFDKKYKIRDL
jgi:hypothetical protein